MFQNIKVDIAYYKTNTDFEMEFNLCGCCRMRLLTDKAPDKKTLVHSLARAVSRSRVIIIVGKLFGEDGVISIAAGATGSKLTVADNAAYGIDSDDEISIINGSTPLVTPEGYFGGCIIEKGPQTMIVLTDNKNVRKSVMKNLIHPYIEELCALDLKEKAASVSGENTAAPKHEAADLPEDVAIPELAEIPTAAVIEETAGIDEDDDFFEDDSSFVFEETPEETDTDTAEEIPETTENDDDYITDTDEIENEGYETEEMGLLTDEDDYEETEIEMPDSGEFASFDDDEMSVESDMHYNDKGMSLKDYRRRNADYYKDEEVFEDLVTEDEMFEERAHIKGGFSLPILILSIVLLVLLIVLCYCIFYVPSTQGVSATAYLKETFDILFG